MTFQGLRRVPPEAARSAAGLEPSDRISRAGLRRLITQLDKTGWFASIQIEETEAGFLVCVQEQPYLASAEYSGSKLLRGETAERVIEGSGVKLQIARPVDPLQLHRAARVLQHRLHELGHPFARVTVAQERVAAGAVRATFLVDDGLYASVQNVVFAGASTIPPGKLQKQLREVQPRTWFAGLRHKNTYTAGRVAADADHLAAFYQSQGFAFARIGEPRIEPVRVRVQRWWPWPHREWQPRLRITLPVHEGPQVRWDSYAVYDCDGRSRDEILLGHPGWKPGAPYSAAALQAIAAHLAKLLPCGSSRAEVVAATEIDRARYSAHVSFRAQPTQHFTLRRIEFTGQDRFPDRFYRRRLGFEEGDSWQPEKLERGLAAISRDGFVKPIPANAIYTEFDPTAGAVDLRIHVEEAGRQRLSLVGGASTIGFAYNLFNFLGAEEVLTGYLEGGPPALQLLVGIAKDGLLGNHAGLGFSLFHHVVRPQLPGQQRQRLFVSTSTGLAQTLDYRLSRTQQVASSYRLESTRLTIPPAVTANALPVRSDFTSSEVSARWQRSTETSSLLAEGAVSGGALGGSQDLVRFSTSAIKHDDRSAPAWGVRWQSAGVFAAPWAANPAVPIPSRLYPAEDWVRGMRAGELARQASPARSGLHLVQAVNLEHAIPFQGNRPLRLLAFADGAAGWLLESDAALAGRAALGLELRWRIPPGAQQRIPLGGETIRLHYALAPWLLSQGRRGAWGWALGNFF